MKRKTLTLCLSLFTCLSLIGVGFAAWIISGGDSKTASGNITVETVTDARFTITVNSESLDALHYGRPATMNVTNAWLTNDSEQTENLSVEFTFTVTSNSEIADATAWNKVVNASVKVLDAQTENATTHSNAWTEALKAEVIADPTIKCEIQEQGTNQATFKVTVSIVWGKYFNYDNPYIFYNDEGKTAATDAEDAVAKLGLIEDLTDKFVVTITAGTAA